MPQLCHPLGFEANPTLKNYNLQDGWITAVCKKVGTATNLRNLRTAGWLGQNSK